MERLVTVNIIILHVMAQPQAVSTVRKMSTFLRDRNLDLRVQATAFHGCRLPLHTLAGCSATQLRKIHSLLESLAPTLLSRSSALPCISQDTCLC